MRLIKSDDVQNGMIRYGFHAPDMTVHEFVETVLSPISAVPLGRLCKWLGDLGLRPCSISNDLCEKRCQGYMPLCEKCWQHVITAMMEAADDGQSSI